MELFNFNMDMYPGIDIVVFSEIFACFGVTLKVSSVYYRSPC